MSVSATKPVVFDPANGSMTRSSGSVRNLMKNSGSADGNRAGCIFRPRSLLRLAYASFAALFPTAPTFAAEDKMMMGCTDADMAKMTTKMDAMAAGDNKKMAMDHMKMAKDSMAAKDMKACEMHMKKSMDAMEKK